MSTYTPEPLAIRHDAPFTDGADGTPTGLHTGPTGRLKVESAPAALAPTTGNIASAAAQVALDTSQVSNVVAYCKGVFAGVNATFEASIDSTNGVDGTWFGVQAVRSNSNVIEATTGVLGAAPAYAWEVSVNGYKWFRVRATAWTSGTQNWVLYPAPYATEPAPAVPTHPVTGSGNFNMLPAAGQTAYSLTTAATTNAAVIKATAGQLWELTAFNPTATAGYLKLYDKATAPTVGTDVPKVTIPVPAGAFASIPCGAAGKRFAAGIGIAVTAAAAATDTGVTVAGIQIHGTFV